MGNEIATQPGNGVPTMDNYPVGLFGKLLDQSSNGSAFQDHQAPELVTVTWLRGDLIPLHTLPYQQHIWSAPCAHSHGRRGEELDALLGISAGSNRSAST